MYGGNSNPPNMRFPPPPTFFRNPPYMNPNFPVGWPPVPPIIPQHHPPWMNANGGQAMIHQGRAGLHTERHLTPQSECMSHIADKKVKSLEKLDKEWIDDNLHRGCCSVKLQEQKGKSTTKISEVTRLHLKAYKLVQRLEQSCQSELSASASLTSADKKELDSILKLLEDENYVRGVSLSVLKREKKRKRIYLKKQEALKRKIDLEDNIKEKHLKTDKWLEDRRKVEDDWKRERKVRKDLDEYLSDIRQKQHSAKKYLQLFNAIAKLRKARCETADRKGQLQPSEAHKEVFVTAHESACIKLREFISECKNEENFMRKYLTEEHEAEERRIKDELEKEEKRKISNWKKERSKVLFESSNGDLDPSDPLWPVQEIHRQGTGSVIGLINIRAQWDQCIGDPGSTIPTPFVEPCLPSNDEWKNYLANS